MIRTLALLLMFFALLSCKEKATEANEDSTTQDVTESAVKKATSPDFDWLLGEWQRTNDQPGQQTYEIWKKQSDSLYKGLGFTLAASNDTIFKESIRLLKEGESWYFKVKMPTEVQTTDFKLIALKEGSFSCENKNNEFPKVISYQNTTRGFLAIISGDEDEIEFEFIPRD